MTTTRRNAFRNLLALAAGSPLFSQSPGSLLEKVNDEDVYGPVNVHEFEIVARKKLHKLAYDFIVGGVEDENTLRANRAAYERTVLLPRVMVDTSKIDMRLKLLGFDLESPIIIAPSGGKNLVLPNADEVVATAALVSKTPVCSATGVQKLLSEGKPLLWWANTIGSPTKESAQTYAKRVADGGGKAIVLTVDNQYQSNRDRNNRNKFDYGYMQTGVPKEGQKPRSPATAAMWQPHTPGMTWNYIEWLKSGAKLPVIVKGILNPEDAALAVQNGGDAVVVSNHGGRQMDGVIATLDALPDCVDAVAGKVPVLMDGGIRRGQDIVKALALGAKAVLVGRAPLWGLGAYGQPGVERVLWMLNAELKLAMGLAGTPNLAAINRKMVKQRSW